MLQADALRSRRMGVGCEQKENERKEGRAETANEAVKFRRNGGNRGFQNGSGTWQTEKRTQHSMAFYVYKCTVEKKNHWEVDIKMSVSKPRNIFHSRKFILAAGCAKWLPCRLSTAELAMSGFAHSNIEWPTMSKST